MNKQDDDFMLTTVDNQFNPFDDFEIWWKEDLRLGHDTCGLLARTSNVSDVASDEVNEQYINSAMDEIVRRWPMIYRKVRKSDYAMAS